MENNFSYEINTEKREIVYNCSGDEDFFDRLMAILEDYKTQDRPDIDNAIVKTSSRYGNVDFKIFKFLTNGSLVAKFLRACERVKREEYEKKLGVCHKIVEELKEITPCDLSNPDSTLFDAWKMCKGVIRVLSEIDLNQLSDDDIKTITATLKGLGCCGCEDAAEKFLPLFMASKSSGVKNNSISRLTHTERSIEYPINLFNNILDQEPDIVKSSLQRAASWNKDWLETQENVKTR